MTPRQKLLSICAKNNVELEYQPGYIQERTGEEIPYNITLDAPNGFLFSASKLHCDCAIGGVSGLKTDWKDALKQVEEFLSYGIEKCVEPECEWCADNPIGETK